MTDQFAQWRQWVEDDVYCIPQDVIGLIPGKYQTKMGQRFVGVAVWLDDDGVLQFIRDGKEITDEKKRYQIFDFVRPVSEEQYEFVTKDHAGDPIYDKLPQTLKDLGVRLKLLTLVPFEIKNREDAESCADAQHVLKQIENTINNQYKDAKEPFNLKLKAVKEMHEPLLDFAKDRRKPFMAALTGYLQKQNDKKGVKGQLGKAISLRSYTLVELSDYKAAFAYFVQEKPDAFKDFVLKLARADVEKGGTPPGIKTTEDRRAQ